ncbi:hypothetical protein JCM6882_003073 [Rhodosporidiobolus microsporus]
MSDSLKVPGQTTPSRSQHQLRQRSPKGQRGRPRKTPPSPPPRLSDRMREVRRSPWFLPTALGFAVLVLALLYSAVRISSRTSDREVYGLVWSSSGAPPPFPATRGAVGVEKNGRVEIYGNDQGNRIRPASVDFKVDEKTQADGQHALDQAVRHALEEAWHLPPHAEKDVGGALHGAAAAAEGQAVVAGGGDAAGEAKPRQRTLQELYADLEELGISAHELEEAWHEGLKEAHER